jgi:hypothetical protein
MMPALRALEKKFALIREIRVKKFVFICVHPRLKIQPPIAPIIHPKMNSGKESFANTAFGMRSAECVTRPPALVPTGQPGNSPAFQRRGSCARPPRVPPGRQNERHNVPLCPPFHPANLCRPSGTCIDFTTNPALKWPSIVSYKIIHYLLALPAGGGMLCQFFDISICFGPFTRSASRCCALRRRPLVAATPVPSWGDGVLVAPELCEGGTSLRLEIVTKPCCIRVRPRLKILARRSSVGTNCRVSVIRARQPLPLRCSVFRFLRIRVNSCNPCLTRLKN